MLILFFFAHSLYSESTLDCTKAEKVYMNCVEDVYRYRKIPQGALTKERTRFLHFCRMHQEKTEKCLTQEGYSSCSLRFFCIQKLYPKKEL